MPRIPASVHRLATQRDKLLVPLLTQCRDLNSAQNELRWLREHAAKDEPQDPTLNKGRLEAQRRHQAKEAAIAPKDDEVKLSKLEALIKRRAAGEPLQYILGDQPFGDLEILCEPNVLIPRPETETYTVNLVKEMMGSGLIGARSDGMSATKKLRILDLCTGTGAIALLLHQELRRLFYKEGQPATSKQMAKQIPMALEIVGIDISPNSVNLARRNLEHNLKQGLLHKSADDDVVFREFDVTKLAQTGGDCKQELANLIGLTEWTYGGKWDVVICNPPYVAPDDYAVGGRTEKSVRNHEPRLALVPPQDESSRLHPADTFYPYVLQIARQIGAQVIVLEVGDTAQADRVKELVPGAKLNNRGHPLVQTWFDDGGVRTMERPKKKLKPAFRSQASEDEAGEESTEQTAQATRSQSLPAASGRNPKETDLLARTDAAPAASARAVVIWRGKWAETRDTLMNPKIRRVEGKMSALTLENEQNRAMRQLKTRLAREKKAELALAGGKSKERGVEAQETGKADAASGKTAEKNMGRMRRSRTKELSRSLPREGTLSSGRAGGSQGTKHRRSRQHS